MRRSLTVRFPTYGAGAEVRIVRAGTPARTLQAGNPRNLHAGDRLALGHGDAGYVVEPAAPRGTVLALATTRASAFNPRPGPTLTLRLPRGARAVRARIVPGLS